MQGRIEKTNRHGEGVHGAEDAVEILALEREQIRERRFAIRGVSRHDHASHGSDALARAEKHVLGSDEADAFGAVVAGGGGVLGSVRVGQHLERARLVHPGHELSEVTADSRRGELGGAADHLARGAVEAHPVALVQLHPAQTQPPVLLVHHELRAPGHARLAPSTRDDRRVRRHAAARGEDTLRGVHPADVLGRRLDAHQDALLALRVQILSRLRVEHDLSDSRAGRGRETHADDVRGVRASSLNCGCRSWSTCVGSTIWIAARVDSPRSRGRRRSSPRRAGALPASRLEHVQLTLLHGELDVLHVLVVLLQQLRVAHEVFVRVRQAFFIVRYPRGSNPGDDVLALRVDQYSPYSRFSPVEGLRVKHTPVPEVSPMFPNTIAWMFTAVPFAP